MNYFSALFLNEISKNHFMNINIIRTNIQPGVNFKFYRFSQLRLHVAGGWSERLNFRAALRRCAVISNFPNRSVSNFIVFI